VEIIKLVCGATKKNTLKKNQIKIIVNEITESDRRYKKLFHHIKIFTHTSKLWKSEICQILSSELVHLKKNLLKSI